MDDRPFKHWPNTLPWVYLLCCRYVRTLHSIHLYLVCPFKEDAPADADHFRRYDIQAVTDVQKTVPGHTDDGKAEEKKKR